VGSTTILNEDLKAAAPAYRFLLFRTRTASLRLRCLGARGECPIYEGPTWLAQGKALPP